MSLTIQKVANNFWIIKKDRKYLGVVRLIRGTEKGDLYYPWHEARQIGEPQGSLEDAAKALDV